jgi:hypothetical protein
MPNHQHYCEVCRYELDQRHFKKHTRSIVHRKAKLIQGMLERNCVTLAEIARRTGLTRERVRQLALRMGYADGRARHAVCRTERRRRGMSEFFVKAEERGFAVEPLGPKSAHINGKFCVQRQSCWRQLRKGKYQYSCLNLCRPTGKFDICAWKLPDGRFLILPEELARFKQTCFQPGEIQKPGKASAAHDYRDYIERWSELGSPGGTE